MTTWIGIEELVLVSKSRQHNTYTVTFSHSHAIPIDVKCESRSILKQISICNTRERPKYGNIFKTEKDRPGSSLFSQNGGH